MKKADTVYSRYWREEIGRCEHCFKKENLQLAHIISRDCRKLRYEPKNKFILCYSCHFIFHRKPLLFAEFVRLKKGNSTYKWLIRESNKLKRITEKFYQDIIKTYETHNRN